MLKHYIRLAFLFNTTVAALLDLPVTMIAAMEDELPDLMKLRGHNG